MNAWLVNGEAAWQLAGWTMLHFLWVGAVVALAGGAVRVACRRAGAGIRYGVSLLTLAGLAAAPVGIAMWLAGTLPRGGSVAESAAAFDVGGGIAGSAPRVIDLAQTPIAGGEGMQGDDARHLAGGWVELPGSNGVENETTALRSIATGDRARLLPSLRGRGMAEATAIYLPWVWLGGAPATFALLATGLVGSRRLRRQCAAVTEGAAFEALERIRKLMRVTQRVALAACEHVAQPVLVGIVRPTILLPAAALTGWSPEELEMVLAHELAHVRRWDNLVNLVQRLVESALFFHPAVWLASRQVRRDREDCCDAAVVSHTRRPAEYAELLVAIAGRRGARSRIAEANLAWGSALANHPLAGRIRRILKLEDEPMWVSRSTLGLAIVLGASLLAAVVALPPIGGAVADDASTPPSVAAATDGGEEEAPSTTEGEAPRSTREGEAKSQADGAPQGPWATRGDAEEAASGEAPARLERPLLVEDELPKLKSDIQLYQSQLVMLQKEQEDIEVLKELALQSPRSSSALELAVKTEVEKDPEIANYQQTLFSINQAIQQQASAGKNFNSGSLKRLAAQRQQTEAMMQQYRAQAEKQARERLATVPNEALRGAMAEYQVRAKSIADRMAEVEQKMKAVHERMAAMAAGSGDAPARAWVGERSTPAPRTVAATYEDASRANFEQAQLQEEMRTYRAALMSMEKEAEDLEVRQQVAEVQSHSDASLDARLEEALRNDRRTEIFENEAIAQEQLLRKLKSETGKDNEEQYRKAQAVYEQLLHDAEAYSDSAGAKYRDRLEKAADEAFESSLVEYKIRAKAIEARRAALTKKLQELEQRMEDLAKSAAHTAAPSTAQNPYYFSTQPRLTEQTLAPAAVREPTDPIQPAATSAAPGPYTPTTPAAASAPTTNSSPFAVQPTAPRTQDFFFWQPTGTPAGPARTLQPGDVILVTAAGISPEQPLGDDFRIEAEGTVPLGPLYGRVKVAGLTVLAAQEAIERHLEKTWKDPSVQVVLSGEAGNAPVGLPWPQAGSGTKLLYDGKTFDAWQRLWQNELKTEKRTEAIAALAAFGRAGMASEAAEAILEVAGQYDFYVIDNQTSEGQLKKQVIDLLTATSASRLPESAWMPALVGRLDTEPGRWKWLASHLLASLITEDAGVREQLFELAQSKDDDIRKSAMWALINSDPKRTNAKVMEVVLQLVRSSDGEEVKTGINMLVSAPHLPGERFMPPKLRKAAEVLPHLFHQDVSVQQTAREAFLALERADAPAVVADLVKRLTATDDAATKLAAVRALAAIGPLATEAEPALREIMQGENHKLTSAAVVALNRMHPDSQTPFGTQALVAWLQGSPEKQALFDETTLQREEQELFSQRDEYGGGGFGGGGRRGGRGGF